MIIRYWESPNKKREAWYIYGIDYAPRVRFFIALGKQGRVLVMGGDRPEQNQKVRDMLTGAGFNLTQRFGRSEDLSNAFLRLGLLDVDVSGNKKPSGGRGRSRAPKKRIAAPDDGAPAPITRHIWR